MIHPTHYTLHMIHTTHHTLHITHDTHNTSHITHYTWYTQHIALNTLHMIHTLHPTQIVPILANLSLISIIADGDTQINIGHLNLVFIVSDSIKLTFINIFDSSAFYWLALTWHEACFMKTIDIPAAPALQWQVQCDPVTHSAGWDVGTNRPRPVAGTTAPPFVSTISRLETTANYTNYPAGARSSGCSGSW